MIRIWDINTGESIIFEGHPDSFGSYFVFSDPYIIMESSEGKIWRGNLDTGESLNFEGYSEPRLLADNRLLLRCFDGTIDIFEIENRKSIKIECPSNDFKDFAILPDARIASITEDNIIHIWDSCSGEKLSLGFLERRPREFSYQDIRKWLVARYNIGFSIFRV